MVVRWCRCVLAPALLVTAATPGNTSGLKELDPTQLNKNINQQHITPDSIEGQILTNVAKYIQMDDDNLSKEGDNVASLRVTFGENPTETLKPMIAALTTQVKTDIKDAGKELEQFDEVLYDLVSNTKNYDQNYDEAAAQFIAAIINGITINGKTYPIDANDPYKDNKLKEAGAAIETELGKKLTETKTFAEFGIDVPEKIRKAAAENFGILIPKTAAANIITITKNKKKDIKAVLRSDNIQINYKDIELTGEAIEEIIQQNLTTDDPEYPEFKHNNTPLQQLINQRIKVSALTTKINEAKTAIENEYKKYTMINTIPEDTLKEITKRLKVRAAVTNQLTETAKNITEETPKTAKELIARIAKAANIPNIYGSQLTRQDKEDITKYIKAIQTVPIRVYLRNVLKMDNINEIQGELGQTPQQKYEAVYNEILSNTPPTEIINAIQTEIDNRDNRIRTKLLKMAAYTTQQSGGKIKINTNADNDTLLTEISQKLCSTASMNQCGFVRLDDRVEDKTYKELANEYKTRSRHNSDDDSDNDDKSEKKLKKPKATTNNPNQTDSDNTDGAKEKNDPLTIKSKTYPPMRITLNPQNLPNENDPKTTIKTTKGYKEDTEDKTTKLKFSSIQKPKSDRKKD